MPKLITVRLIGGLGNHLLGYYAGAPRVRYEDSNDAHAVCKAKLTHKPTPEVGLQTTDPVDRWTSGRQLPNHRARAELLGRMTVCSGRDSLVP